MLEVLPSLLVFCRSATTQKNSWNLRISDQRHGSSLHTQICLKSPVWQAHICQATERISTMCGFVPIENLIHQYSWHFMTWNPSGYGDCDSLSTISGILLDPHFSRVRLVGLWIQHGRHPARHWHRRVGTSSGHGVTEGINWQKLRPNVFQCEFQSFLLSNF